MIYYNSRDIRCKKPFGAIPKGDFVSFSVFLSDEAHGTWFGEVSLEIAREGFPAQHINGVRKGSEYTFHWDAEMPGLYFYFFKASYNGFESEKSETHQLMVYEVDENETPDWLSRGLMYQIFPDRFARSESYCLPAQNKNYFVHEKWGELPVHAPDENGIIWNNDFFGGNLKGITENLDYLQSLGVTVIYLNPIFEAFSNHRYDTGDYLAIDPMLGSEEDFSCLCAEAEAKGMRVIFDGVFNHTGSDSVYFNRYGRFPSLGAFQSWDSPYRKWYDFIEYPHRYHSWWGIDTLPSINETEPSYLDFIIRNEDSVIRHWLRAGASGVRLDVVDELPDEFLDELRIVVKQEKKDAAIIGEVWEDASNKIAYGQRRRYFQGKQLDSVMNYPLKDAIIRFLGHDHDAANFAETVEQLWENYPPHAFNSLMNILGTHDTKRILTVFKESCDDEQMARQRLFSALLLWAFMPGIPCVYYGDEIGMEGDRDPMNRQCFCPGQAVTEIRNYYRRVLHFRKGIDDIGDMSYSPVHAHGGYYSFERIGERQKLLVAINDGEDGVTIAFEDDDKIVDFVISGKVSYLGNNAFDVTSKSGIAILINTAIKP